MIKKYISLFYILLAIISTVEGQDTGFENFNLEYKAINVEPCDGYDVTLALLNKTVERYKDEIIPIIDISHLSKLRTAVYDCIQFSTNENSNEIQYIKRNANIKNNILGDYSWVLVRSEWANYINSSESSKQVAAWHLQNAVTYYRELARESDSASVQQKRLMLMLGYMDSVEKDAQAAERWDEVRLKQYIRNEINSIISLTGTSAANINIRTGIQEMTTSARDAYVIAASAEATAKQLVSLIYGTESAYLDAISELTPNEREKFEQQLPYVNHYMRELDASRLPDSLIKKYSDLRKTVFKENSVNCGPLANSTKGGSDENDNLRVACDYETLYLGEQTAVPSKRTSERFLNRVAIKLNEEFNRGNENHLNLLTESTRSKCVNAEITVLTDCMKFLRSEFAKNLGTLKSTRQTLRQKMLDFSLTKEGEVFCRKLQDKKLSCINLGFFNNNINLDSVQIEVDCKFNKILSEESESRDDITELNKLFKDHVDTGHFLNKQFETAKKDAIQAEETCKSFLDVRDRYKEINKKNQISSAKAMWDLLLGPEEFNSFLGGASGSEEVISSNEKKINSLVITPILELLKIKNHCDTLTSNNKDECETFKALLELNLISNEKRCEELKRKQNDTPCVNAEFYLPYEIADENMDAGKIQLYNILANIIPDKKASVSETISQIDWLETLVSKIENFRDGEPKEDTINTQVTATGQVYFCRIITELNILLKDKYRNVEVEACAITIDES